MVPFRWIEVFLFSLLILQCRGNNITETQPVTTQSENTTTIEPTSANGTERTSSGNNTTTPKPTTSTTTNTTTIEPTSANGTERISSGDNTTTPKPTTSTTTNTTTISPSSEPTTTAGTTGKKYTELWKCFIIVLVGIVVLILAIVITTWKKSNGSKTQVEEATKVAGERSCQKNAGDEDVSYVSVSFIRRSKCKAKVCNHNDDQDDTVTYSTLKFPFSSDGVSTDPSDLYSTVNKQKKQVPA
ncbi:integumentary mucin C.1-like isoform X1 [Oreochromis aureus]|uniref:integumentary mucin C.1-like isoform X1 n=1 Tax=Oreochromis aureus TaxID=47969 RepID=UPI001953661E|nr:integumentary mucin C.1-like isoform X1 [Oreochromis aureus]